MLHKTSKLYIYNPSSKESFNTYNPEAPNIMFSN